MRKVIFRRTEKEKVQKVKDTHGHVKWRMDYYDIGLLRVQEATNTSLNSAAGFQVFTVRPLH